MILSKGVCGAMTVWTAGALFVSYGAGLEIFFTLEIIGLLMIREFISSFAGTDVRERLDLFIYAGLFVFAAIVVRRVWLAIS